MIAAVKYTVCENDITYSTDSKKQNEQKFQDKCWRYVTIPGESRKGE
jgi:hypothetical protein